MMTARSFSVLCCMLLATSFIGATHANKIPRDADLGPFQDISKISNTPLNDYSTIDIPEDASKLQTLFASDNGGSTGGRVFFDIKIKRVPELKIYGIDTNTQGSGQLTLEIWYRTGTSVGFERSVDGWTNGSMVVGEGKGGGNPTRMLVVGDGPLVLPCDLIANPGGCVYGIALNFVNGNHLYTNGNYVYSDANIELSLGRASNNGFDDPDSSVFDPRTWNGALYYSACTPLLEMSDEVMQELCPDYNINGGSNGVPIYGPNAVMCSSKQQSKYGSRLLLSMANGLFGGRTDGSDCTSYCLWDVFNSKKYYRWDNGKQCWRFKQGWSTCAGSTQDERQYAIDRQSGLCPADLS